jgi:hypothetical protein
VVFKTVPVPGAAEVYSLEVDAAGLVYGLTTGSQFFVFDPVRREVVQRADLSALGELVRPALARGPDGIIYGALSHTVFRVEPTDHRITAIAQTPVPVTAGLAIIGNQLYFASQARIWRCQL